MARFTYISKQQSDFAISKFPETKTIAKISKFTVVDYRLYRCKTIQ